MTDAIKQIVITTAIAVASFAFGIFLFVIY